MALREFDFEKDPTVSVVKKILTDAIKMKATDIHFDPTSDELIVKFRINGDLTEYTTAPENVKSNIITRVKIISGMNITDSLLPQIGAINFEIDSKTHNMRVSSLPVADGEKIVVHISNYAKNIKSISKIGFNSKDIIKIKELLREPQGIILVTGTASSGKTTTLYSLLKELNSKANNIISIEDPIKMKINGINQVQIAPEKGLTYRTLLRNILLQDPNIIAINELVDDETARNALRASLSGRLVISTMHTKSLYQTIDTLLNMDVENYLLGSNLIGIISQRLVKKLCPTCREKRKATKYEARIIKEILNEEVDELYYPKGCEDCKNGYVDQIPVAEVIKIDNELRSAISNNKKRDLIRKIIYEENSSIIQDGFKKVLAGETSFQEIIRIMDLKVDFTNDNKDLIDIILGNKKIEDDPIDDEENNDYSESVSEEIDEKNSSTSKDDEEKNQDKKEKEEETESTNSKEEEISTDEKKDNDTSESKNEIKEEDTKKDSENEPTKNEKKQEATIEVNINNNKPKDNDADKIAESIKEIQKNEEEMDKALSSILENNNNNNDDENNKKEKQNESVPKERKKTKIVNIDDDDDDFNYDDSYNLKF